MNAEADDTRVPKRTPLNQKLGFWIVLLLAIIIGMIIWNNNSTNKNNRGPKGTPVIPAVAKSSNVPVYITALGSVTPTYTVTVRTQVNGQLMTVLFREGQMVKKGDLLAEIDQRPFLAQLTEYQGQLIRDTALYENAKIDLKRYQTLWKQDSIAQQQFATQQSLVRQYEGAMKTDEGLIQTTQVNLIYCHITSPIDGRIGLRLVDPGNFVQTSDTNGIAIINMLNPITVVFTIPEDYIPDVLYKINANVPLTVEAFDRQQNRLLATGSLLTIDNQVDTSTGTVKLKAQFQNEKNMLFPNQFVNVRLLVKVLENATVVPTAAIQHSTKGTFVYRLNHDSTVTIKPVTVGVTTDDSTTVSNGVNPGDSVIVEGADKLVDGASVVLADKQQQQTPPPSKKSIGWAQLSKPHNWYKWMLAVHSISHGRIPA